jgi:uncharacterized protein with HEPN domain
LSSKKPLQRLQDIVQNADAIASYVAGVVLDALERDSMRDDAVERCLERISEAANKLGDYAFELIPNQPWKKIRGLGNRLRHEYDEIQRDQLWSFIQTDVPSLRAACAEALMRFK